jgi:hypothetical protein
MAGVEERVQAFLNSWLKVKEQLEEVLKDDERLLHGDGVSGSLPSGSKDDIPETLGQSNSGL